MPPELERLVADIVGSIADHNAALAAGRISVDTWQQLIARDLLVGHYAAMMTGRDTKDLSASARNQVLTTVAEQVDYLNRFADQIARTGWQEAYGARALLYAGSVKGTYWRGRTFGLDLPYMPGDGSSECLGNCGCRWDIAYDGDPEDLNATARWVRGKDDSCATCINRAGVVFQFREGVRV